MTTKCDYCDIAQHESRAEVLFEDNDVVVAVKDMAITPGHLVVFPRVHHTILELVPHALLNKCVNTATKMSTAVFEGLGSHGTNIIINNGLGADQSVPHFGIEIVPRMENDGLALQWEGKQLPEDEMERLFSQISKDTITFVKEGLKEKPTVMEEKHGDVENRRESKGRVNEVDEQYRGKIESGGKKEKETNYLIKSLKRIP